MIKQPRSLSKIERDLRALLRGRVLADPVARYCYATDASIFRIVPQLIVQPRSPEDIQALLIYANENQLTITARGAGTGLAGESLNSGIVLDCSVFLNQIGPLDHQQQSIKVEAGVVPDLLNQKICQNGLIFAPDPSTSNRCTIGGMIANNAAGAHSLKYGMTNRWVKSLDLFLSDGSSVRFAPYELDSDKVNKLLTATSLESRIYRAIIPLLKEKQNDIERHWPDLPRNRHGYLINQVLTEKRIDLTQLICASEGTLGIIWQAELGLTTNLTGKTLLCLAYYDRLEAAAAVSNLLAFSPSAIELIDQYCLGLLRTNRTYQEILSPKIKSLLLVEFLAESSSAANEAARAARFDFLSSGKSGDSWLLEDHDKIELFWNMRKHISAMLNKLQSDRQPLAVIEDVSVHPSKLRLYLEGVEKILSQRQLEYLVFGHAGAGVVHVRPLLNRHDAKLQQWLPQLCHEVYDLALQLGGSISGEHGDGLLRAPFIRKQYGPLFGAFEQIKNCFDPDRILNPGKKSDCVDFSAWQTSLRFQSPKPENFSPQLNWPDQHLLKQVEACNGCGACRSLAKNGYFCPAFRAFGQELASARAKANVMRAVLAGELEQPDLAKLHELTQYCLNCKKCESECPAGVSAVNCNLELRAQGFLRHQVPAQVRLISQVESALPLLKPVAKLLNFMVNLKWTKRLLPLLGLTKSRALPRFEGISIQDPKSIRSQATQTSSQTVKAVYFADMASYYLRHDLADALLSITYHCGIEVLIPPQKTSGLVPFSYGNLAAARKLAQYNFEQLLPFAKAGYQIVCSEPSTLLMLQEEYPLLLKDRSYHFVAEAAIEACHFLLQLKQKGLLNFRLNSLPLTLGYHRPCHLRPPATESSALSLLADIPDLTIRTISTNCCGIAGTFGMRSKYYQASLEIGQELFQALKDPEINYGLTECSACQMQMEHGVPEKKTLNPLQVFAAALPAATGRSD